MSEMGFTGTTFARSATHGVSGSAECRELLQKCRWRGEYALVLHDGSKCSVAALRYTCLWYVILFIATLSFM